LLGAICEADLSSLSDEILESQWTEVLDRVSDNGLLDALKYEFSTLCITNIDGKYKLWEARLLEIVHDAVMLKLNDFLGKVTSIQEMILNVSKEILLWDKKYDSGTDAQNEIVESFDKIYAAKNHLEYIIRESFKMGQNVSSILKSEQSRMLTKVTEKQRMRMDQHSALESIFIEKSRYCTNLESKVDIMNKLTSCEISEMFGNVLKFSVELSDISRINSAFRITSNGRPSFLKDDIYVESLVEDGNEQKHKSYLSFIEKAFLNEWFNDTSKEKSSIEAINCTSTWRRDVCGSIFTFIHHFEHMLCEINLQN